MKSLVGVAANGESERDLWADFENVQLGHTAAAAVETTSTTENFMHLGSSPAPCLREDRQIRSLKEESDFDDWQEFKAPDETRECYQFSLLSSQVLKSCFETANEDNCTRYLDGDGCIFHEHR